MTNKLPVGWCECKLDDFVQILDSERKPINANERDERLKKAEGKPLYPYYGATGQVGYIDDYLSDGEYVLLGEDGAPFLDPFKNKAYIVNGKFWVNNHAHILKGFGSISNQFICYWLNSVSYRPYVSGTTRLKLNQAKMKEIACNLPPLNVQKRIVAKIEEVFAKVDAGVEKLKSVAEDLKKYRQSVLHSAFTGKLHKTTDWKQVQLKDVCEVLGGYAFKSTDFSEFGYQILRMGNIKPFTLNLNEKPVYINNLNKNLVDKYLLQTNDIVITLTGTRRKRDYGYVVLIKEDKHLLLNQRLARVRPLKNINALYLAYALQSEPYQTQFFSYETGNVGQGNVSMKALTDEKIFIPSLPEQEKIVEGIEKRFAVADKLEEAVSNSLKQAEELKQSILKKAFGGRLVPQDPNDEPAQILLDRIKAEKSTQLKKRKRK